MKYSALMSTRARLALLPFVVILAAQCDNPTSPSDSNGAPSFAVAAIDPISALEGTPVQFFCGASSDAEGDPLLCQWDFGNDGTLDAECNTADRNCRWDFDHDGVFEGTQTGSFVYKWPDQGTFDVRLDVSDASGDRSSATTQVSVADVAPIITGRTPLIFDVGQRQRAHTRFKDPGADSAWTFVFDWGDGTIVGPKLAPGPDIGIGQHHAYSAPGEYVVTVTVTDKDGVTSTFTRIATVVENQKPVAVAGGPYTGTEGTDVVFSSEGTTDDQPDLLTYQWDFGDGSRSSERNAVRRYRDNGVYSVRLIVADPTGAADTAYTTADVQNVAPSGLPRWPAPREGTAYALSMNGIDPSPVDRALLQYTFDCGQGAGPTAWSTTNAVTCPGLPDQGPITVTIGVRDKDGASNTYVQTVNATNVGPTVTVTPIGATTIPVGGTIQLEGRYTDLGAADGPFNYRIVWGDGITTTGSTPETVTTTPLTASHVFTRAGTFTVFLYVTDKDLAQSRASFVVTVTP